MAPTIRSELDVLLDKVQDPALRADLRSQIDRLKQRRSFGLVFEQHIPERMRLPQHPIRVGSHVVSRDDDDSPTWEVAAIDDGIVTLLPIRDSGGANLQHGDHGAAGAHESAPVDSLVVISDFGEPVLPGLRHLGSVERGGDKPYHIVIKGENHHALEALRFTHAGRVDCIYIDPPYNSGARDWKYNNDYVDENDAYRHSKWLAFMERRLKLAKELLNPEDSVLIVTIDEKEYLRLGLLLEQTFLDAETQMISVVISPQGSARPGGFSRVEEYAYFVRLGRAEMARGPDDMLMGVEEAASAPVWFSMIRSGTGAKRSDSPNLFYPVFIDEATRSVMDIGDPLPMASPRVSVPVPRGTVAVWPIRRDGSEGRWQLAVDSFRSLLAEGFAKIGDKNNTGGWSIMYVRSGDRQRILDGEIVRVGVDEDGYPDFQRAGATASRIPKSVWYRLAHDAGKQGSMLLNRFIPGRRFPFPKSLYAVEDAIRFVVKDKSNAVVLDFFAGSGTTAHAVARLNRHDGGRRTSIMITNNEVSVDEANDLRRQGFRPGSPEWESLGIFEHITRPRLTAAITGITPDGQPIKGDYRFTDEFPMADGFEENVTFFELRYLDADDVDLGLAFDDIAPLLWLRAGAEGEIARRSDEGGTPLPYVWTDRYGVLFDEDRWRRFVLERPESARAVFIVTYSPTAFAGITAELPTDIAVIRLPDSYLSMFLPDRGRA